MLENSEIFTNFALKSLMYNLLISRCKMLNMWFSTPNDS